VTHSSRTTNESAKLEGAIEIREQKLNGGLRSNSRPEPLPSSEVGWTVICVDEFFSCFQEVTTSQPVKLAGKHALMNRKK